MMADQHLGGSVHRRGVERLLDVPDPALVDRRRALAVEDAVEVAPLARREARVPALRRDLGCQAKSPMKTLDLAAVRREGEQVLLEFASRSFLHRQVRSMTGSLAQVGVGRWTAADLKAALEARDRKACGPVAPAEGLYLTYVGYEHS